MSVGADPAWPALPLALCQATYETLHTWLQIVGKTRLALAPMQNHWWQVALYVTPRGLTTSTIPCRDQAFVVDLDFIAHELAIRTSSGMTRLLPLGSHTGCDFYRDYIAALRALGILPTRGFPAAQRHAIQAGRPTARITS